MDKFKNSLLKILYSSGVVKKSRELHEEDIVHYVDELNNERANLQEKAEEFFGNEKKVRC